AAWLPRWSGEGGGGGGCGGGGGGGRGGGGGGGGASARVAYPTRSDSWRHPLTRIPSLRSESDLSPQAGRGEGCGTAGASLRVTYAASPRRPAPGGPSSPRPTRAGVPGRYRPAARSDLRRGGPWRGPARRNPARG